MPILRSSEIPPHQRAEFQRVRRGWYASPDVGSDEITACRLGGKLTASSALRVRGVWLWHDRKLHVRVGEHAARLQHSPSVCVHYSGATEAGVDGIERALREMAKCATDLEVVTAMDSLLDRRMLKLEDLLQLAVHASAKFRRLVAMAEPGMQSGYETKMRLWLRSKRIRFRWQVVIPGVGRVDFLIGTRIVLEMDGYAYHSREEFTSDRRRDLELQRRGYIVLRVSAQMADSGWDDVCATITDLVARRKHR